MLVEFKLNSADVLVKATKIAGESMASSIQGPVISSTPSTSASVYLQFESEINLLI